MSWIRNRKTAHALVAGSVLLTAGAAAADVLIVRSIGPSAKNFAPGKRLPDGKPVLLKAGDELVVLDAAGTRMLRGPGNIIPNNAAGSASASAAGARRGRSRIAAVRQPPLPGRWDIVVSESGLTCVGDPKDVNLWRDDRDGTEFIVTRVSDKKALKLAWPAGEAAVPWPSQFAISEGGEFQVHFPNNPDSAKVRFKMLPSKPFEKEDAAAAFITHDCKLQLDRFIEVETTPAG